MSAVLVGTLTSPAAATRIVVMHFAAADRDRLEQWQRHLSHVVGVAAGPELSAASSRADTFTWQLVAANHRVLARGARSAATAQAAVDDALGVARTSEAIVPRMVKGQVGAVYGWHASVAGSPVLVCSRWYATERDRREALRVAIAGIATATPVDHVRRLSSSRGRS